jgi:hypothetical protein
MVTATALVPLNVNDAATRAPEHPFTFASVAFKVTFKVGLVGLIAVPLAMCTTTSAAAEPCIAATVVTTSSGADQFAQCGVGVLPGVGEVEQHVGEGSVGSGVAVVCRETDAVVVIVLDGLSVDNAALGVGERDGSSVMVAVPQGEVVIDRVADMLNDPLRKEGEGVHPHVAVLLERLLDTDAVSDCDGVEDSCCSSVP